jgi:hypothetical protein
MFQRQGISVCSNACMVVLLAMAVGHLEWLCRMVVLLSRMVVFLSLHGACMDGNHLLDSPSKQAC